MLKHMADRQGRPGLREHERLRAQSNGDLSMLQRFTMRLLLLSVAWPCAVLAHHSFANIYDSTRSVTLEGVVSQFAFIHPHPYLIIDVMQGAAVSKSWRAEMDNRFELTDIGVTALTFKPGDRVIVSGSPGRKEPQTLYLWKLERPLDGLRYEQIGSTPSIHIP
jgi:hypothetical protein